MLPPFLTSQFLCLLLWVTEWYDIGRISTAETPLKLRWGNSSRPDHLQRSVFAGYECSLVDLNLMPFYRQQPFVFLPRLD
ncbi:hypothetical protein HAX54_041107 [Datura stramonium]|uniref:Secreted protein n=1 Tax=Datura stramonium TaxID=4076 RepID=A0ABS8RP34_DATST|nr:hypothetical protein [Datura stramonium]